MEGNEILANLPINQLSYSSLRLFVTNPQKWFDCYVNGNWDNRTSPSMLAGTGFHKAVETYLISGDKERAILEAMERMAWTKDVDIDFGKTGSREKTVKDMKAGFEAWLEWYAANPIGNVAEAESNYTTPLIVNGVELPLPVKAKTDCIAEQDGRTILFDWKLVASHSDKTTEKGDYVLQAMFNYFVVKGCTGREPVAMRFVEVKKSASKDGGDRVEIYEVEFDFGKFPHYLTSFLKMYGSFIKLATMPEFVYMPNVWDMMNGQASWELLKADVEFINQ
jgi:hypothetical protein